MTSNVPIQTALQQYALSGPAVLIRHNENATYRVGKDVLLRIHQPKEGFDTALLSGGVSAFTLRHSEMEFLLHLQKHDLYVQTPLLTKDGRLVAEINGTPVTALTWIRGNTLERLFFTPEHAKRLGEMLGRLHLACASLPAARDAIHYDEALCMRLAQRVQRGEAEGCITCAHVHTITKTLAAIGGHLLRAKQDPDAFIRVHADLSLSNLLATDKGFVPIDFSLSGYCHWAMDLASLKHNLPDANVQNGIAQGYHGITGRTAADADIAPLFALQVLLFIACQYERYCQQEWFAQRMDAWCAEIFEPLLSIA